MTIRNYRDPMPAPGATRAQLDTQHICDQCELWFERQIDRLDQRLMNGEIGQPAYDIEFTRLADRVEAMIDERLKEAGLC